MARAQVPWLRELARLYGVQTAYYDAAHRRRQASPEALLSVLRALGAPLETFRDAPGAARERRQALWQRLLEPVVVAWGGGPAGVELRLPQEQADRSLVCQLTLEGGETRRWVCDLSRLNPLRTAEVEGRRYVAKRLVLPDGLPWGYHRLALEGLGTSAEAMVISAPIEAYAPSGREREKLWGLFAPLYALHSQGSWGAGDLSDLEALMAWVAELGGAAVATLPLLASYLDEPFDPSPYAPASRLFWNEFYLDVARVPEMGRCPSAQALLGSAEMRGEREALRSIPLVDYRRQMALKRRVLQELATCLFSGASERRAALEGFVAAHPQVEDYARFRATVERRRAGWWLWPQPLRDGLIREGEYDEEARRYHLYVQWLAEEQLRALWQRGQALGVRMYLDLPLGAHADSYDVWRERPLFALDIAAGAPPGTFFTRGQDWGFPPLQPEAIRQQGYRYYIACLRHLLRYAGFLRVDHVMSLHRLFWIPKGLEPSDGAYVSYHAQEFYAILSLESHRHQAWIVGEDLGIVPPSVRPTMARHGIQRMSVTQNELTAAPGRALREVSSRSVASLNTHDMPPFAAFWRDLDLEDRRQLGLLDAEGAEAEKRDRLALREALAAFLRSRGWLQKASVDAQSFLRACLAHLAASPAPLLVVNLEDLWLEVQPQNVPGTQGERPNWRRKARYTFEAFSQMHGLLDLLREIDRLRRGAKARPPSPAAMDDGQT